MSFDDACSPSGSVGDTQHNHARASVRPLSVLVSRDGTNRQPPPATSRALRDVASCETVGSGRRGERLTGFEEALIVENRRPVDAEQSHLSSSASVAAGAGLLGEN